MLDSLLEETNIVIVLLLFTRSVISDMSSRAMEQKNGHLLHDKPNHGEEESQ